MEKEQSFALNNFFSPNLKFLSFFLGLQHRRTTNKIHEEVEGARGSFMLQNDKDTKEIKTIASWDSLNDWKKFWHDSNHSQMQLMHDLGERTSVEIFREVDDFTR